MPLLTYLEQGENFPSSEKALAYPNGLLAAGGDLNAATLLAAYRRGIFPWYEEPQPVLWWTPDPRSVLVPEELHVSRTLRKALRGSGWSFTADCVFTEVMQQCAAPRPGQEGTWIDRSMLQAYTELHELGWAHSIEVRDASEQLQGGLYGVCIGRVFFGESMFSRVPNASKAAMLALTLLLQEKHVTLIDCQVESTHLNSLGAKAMTRVDFEKVVQQTASRENAPGRWVLRANADDLIQRFDSI